MSEFAILKLALIEPSLTNPRKTFNPAKLTELANSIKASGVHQPVLVRPLPGSRVSDTARGVQYELVCGERRLRASQEAGVATIPAMIRVLTDAEVLEIQIVENLQRDDLTPLEEAEGYQALMDHATITADQVADKIAKSRSYVYMRLKLLDLCPDAKVSLRDGTIDPSRAVLVARIPDHKLQLKAMKEIVEGAGYYRGHREPMTYREAATHVQQNYMLKLADARFNIKDESLVAAAGACTTCPKRTGHSPDLFADVKSADVCIDPVCFHKKEEAHAAALVSVAKAKGQTVIAGKEAQELALTNYNGTKFKGYRRLDSAEDSPTDVPLRKIIGEQMKAEGIKPVMIADPNKKTGMVECLPNDVVLRLLKAVEGQAAAAKTVTKEVKELVAEKKAKAESKAKDQYEKEWRADLVRDAFATMMDDADINAFNTDVHRYLVKRAARNLSTEHAAAICKILNLGKVSPVFAISEFAKETPNPELLHLLIVMQEASGPHEHSYGDNVANEGLMLVAGNVFGDQLLGVITEIKSEAKERIMPTPVKKAPAATAPLAQPTTKGGKAKPTAPPAARARKTTPEEALSGIAAAMQSEDRAATSPPEAQQGETQAAVSTGKGAKPVAVSTRPVLYRGPNGESWSGRGQKPKWLTAYLDGGGTLDQLLDMPKPVKAWPFPPVSEKQATLSLPQQPVAGFSVGQTVRVTTQSDKLRMKHDKYSGKTGTVTGFDVGGKELDIKIGRDTRCFEPGELELVPA